MPKLKINGIEVEVEKGTTVLEAARFLGLPIPTLCHDDGLTPYGACRLCLVEVFNSRGSRLVSACTLEAEEGLVVETHSARVERARKLILEMYVATSPQSKTIQDLASRYGVRECRLEAKNKDCIECGLCVRICEQQMMAGAIGFAGRGLHRRVACAFNITSPLCRQCGTCLYICPVCEQRCHGSAAETTLCNGCVNFATVCFQSYDNAMCFLDPCHACELAGPFRKDVPIKLQAETSAKS